VEESEIGLHATSMMPTQSCCVGWAKRLRLLRDNQNEKSGNQGENGRIAGRFDDCRWRRRAQAVFALRLMSRVTPMLF
jgi:hypothetical protein